MQPITHILCPVDFSDFSRHALDHAAGLARHYGATLTALYAFPPQANFLPPLDAGGYVPYIYTPEDVAGFQRSLEQFVGNVGYPVRSMAIEAPAAPEILFQADRLHADLIVMGTHGRTGFERAFLGSVTERILGKSPRPVLVVPPRAPDAVPFGPDLYARIVCAVDFSEGSRAAAAWAAELAVASNAELLLVHVIAPAVRFQPVMMGAGAGPEDHADLRAEARERLRDAVSADLRARATISELVVDGRAADEVVRIAGEHKADLIVAGAHTGRGGLFGLGSTANHIVRSASCPVLIVRG